MIGSIYELQVLNGSSMFSMFTFDFEECFGDDPVDLAGVLAHVGQARVGDGQLVNKALILN